MLTDPGRRTNPGNANAPRWLLSGHTRCGICADGSTMHASGMGGYGPERGSAYRCDKGSHCATPAIPADQAMAKVMIARLGQPDIADLLPTPEPRPEVDVTGLRAEARKLHAKRDDLARLLSEDMLTEAGVRQERKRIDARLAEISTELADATQIDLLPELRALGADPARVWKELSLARQREIVRLPCDVTLLPGRMRQPFDPELQMRIDWRQ
jgi:site-specific DNA recombinase